MAPLDPPRIRLAAADDMAATTAIYNHYVAHSACTYETEPSTHDDPAGWLAARDPGHPLTVAERGGVIVGWASLSSFHTRCGYRTTAETSVYVHPDHLGEGLGTALLRDLVSRAESLGHHTLIALIDADQPASLALHRRLGFKEVGRLHEVGRKFDTWRDVVYMQRMLG